MSMILGVHISDGILSGPWLIGGWAVAAALLFWSGRRVDPAELPRIGLPTAACFISSLIHIRVLVSSAHLLLNGLAGVMLGRRAVLAVFVGLLFQYLFLQHGGLTSLGVNTCVLGLPAAAAGLLFRPARSFVIARPGLSIGVGVAAWLWTAVMGIELIVRSEWPVVTAVSPLLIVTVLMAGVVSGLGYRRLRLDPHFPLGLVVGEMTALATILLNFLALGFGSVRGGEWTQLASGVLLVNLPIAAIEGLVLSFTVSYLLRVKPEMLAAT